MMALHYYGTILRLSDDSEYPKWFALLVSLVKNTKPYNTDTADASCVKIMPVN